MSAEFKVIHIDPEGSGMDYAGHMGKTVYNAKRCCENCTVIFGDMSGLTDVGPFLLNELEPTNEEALEVRREIDALRIKRGMVFTG